ncbi:hypothetical protein [Persicirhabdus sediminis]|uniref:Uncharacterized protein n=1 Tax=Persicirhabdus sediminis TaxID=454144 RepID=A0A8J7MCN7_9BACT|nr:hypothetical protein [Persicirhabdus sediminis]MBK1790641.1 hypothetical protein [Persicirhabdus sediminis]
MKNAIKACSLIAFMFSAPLALADSDCGKCGGKDKKKVEKTEFSNDCGGCEKKDKCKKDCDKKDCDKCKKK